MHMEDWNGYRAQILAGVGNIPNLSPDTVRGYTALSGAVAKTGHLAAKTRELIARAVAISVNAGAALVYSTRTFDAFQAAKEAQG